MQMQTQSSVNGQNATCLNWTREDQPDLYFYEMIQHAANGVDRARTWQWFRNDKCHQRTLIDERRVSATGRDGPTPRPRANDARGAVAKACCREPMTPNMVAWIWTPGPD
jgi:hypothetical protein